MVPFFELYRFLLSQIKDRRSERFQRSFVINLLELRRLRQPLRLKTTLQSTLGKLDVCEVVWGVMSVRSRFEVQV